MVGVENNICAENYIVFIDNYGVFRVPSHFGPYTGFGIFLDHRGHVMLPILKTPKKLLLQFFFLSLPIFTLNGLD